MIANIFHRVNDELRDNKWTLMTGAALGLLITAALFYFVPVVSMQGEIVSRTDDSVTLRVWGKKYRGTCKFLDISGYAAKGAFMRDTKAVKLGLPEDGSTKPAGTFDLGNWLIFPVTGADRVLMYVTHSCGPGDVRVTKIAEVQL